MSSRTKNFGILGNNGAGAINIRISGCHVKMEIEVWEATSVSFLWNNFGYSEDSTINVENMLLEGNLYTESSDILAINRDLPESIKYSFVNYSNQFLMKFTASRVLFVFAQENLSSSN